MARTNRNNQLDNRTNRLKLPTEKRFYATIGDGLALCYRRDKSGIGTFSARVYIGVKKYAYYNVGEADDFKDADGQTVFSYFEAAEQARKVEKEYKTDAGLIIAPLTVAKATEDYLNWYKLNRKSFNSVSITINAYILPNFGNRLINELTTLEIKQWHENLAAQPRHRKRKKKKGRGKRRQTESLPSLKQSLTKRFMTGKFPTIPLGGV